MSASDHIRKRGMFKRRRDRIDVVPFGEGFLVVVGGVALALDREAAEELTLQLADAVEAADPFDVRRIESSN